MGSWYIVMNALRTPVVIIVYHLLGCPANLTHLPPTSRRVPFSHCQRPFGKKTTTLGYHTTSHRTGHTICWLGRTFWWRRLESNQQCRSGGFTVHWGYQFSYISNLAVSTGVEPVSAPWQGAILTDILWDQNLVHRRGIEPLLFTWKANVLTDRRTVH